MNKYIILSFFAQAISAQEVQFWIEKIKREAFDNHYPLISAAEKGNLSKVNECIEKGVSIEETSTRGTTALMYAAGEGHSEVVSLLLAKGANVDVANFWGATALIWAIEGRNKETAALLLANGSNPNDSRHGRFTALMSAAREEDRGLVSLLLVNGADAMQVRDEDKKTALDISETDEIKRMIQEIMQKPMKLRAKEAIVEGYSLLVKEESSKVSFHLPKEIVEIVLGLLY